MPRLTKVNYWQCFQPYVHQLLNSAKGYMTVEQVQRKYQGKGKLREIVSSLPTTKVKLYIQLLIFANACLGHPIPSPTELQLHGNFKMHLWYKWLVVEMKLVPHDPA